MRKALPWLKLLFAVVVVGGVGWMFLRILRSDELRQIDAGSALRPAGGDYLDSGRTLRQAAPPRGPLRVLTDAVGSGRLDLAAGGVLYLAGLGLSGLFWLRLQRRVGEPLPPGPGFRAYFLSHLGKYAPVGKGWALLVRVTLGTQAGARPGTAALTGSYETLTTMAAGALLAAVLLPFLPGSGRHLWTALGLLVLAGVPIVPSVFNRLVARLSRRFAPDAAPLARLGEATLLSGLALTACGWLLLGASLTAVVRALDGGVDGWGGLWLRCVACVAVSWVAGFVASTPGGLGVRELLVQQMLEPTLGKARSVLAAILLRLLWTVAELAAAAVLYWTPARPADVGRAGSVSDRREAPPVADAPGSPPPARVSEGASHGTA